jgi:hypothetical protein
MAKLTDFQTPTGATGNLLNPTSWLSLIMGTVVLLITFSVGQNVANKLNGRGGGLIDSKPENPFQTVQTTKSEVKFV